MQRLLETIGGMRELLLLAWKTRFRLRGKYWRWRYETAFGTDPTRKPTRTERIRAMLDYGRWVYRTKRAVRRNSICIARSLKGEQCPPAH